MEKIAAVDLPYEADHPHAKIDLYRQNSVSVRVRIIDPDFVGYGRPQRSQQAWRYLEKLPDDVQSDISTVFCRLLPMKQKARLQTSSSTTQSRPNFSQGKVPPAMNDVLPNETAKSRCGHDLGGAPRS